MHEACRIKLILMTFISAGVFADSPTDFVVDTRTVSQTNPSGKVTCTITNPSGAKTNNYITPMADGTYRISYTPFEEGRHVIDIMYDGIPIPGSPFAVNVRRGCEPKKVKAFGPGLERGVVNKSNTFTIETKGWLLVAKWDFNVTSFLSGEKFCSCCLNCDFQGRELEDSDLPLKDHQKPK